MTARVSITPEAEEQAEQAAEWWEGNRPAAPMLFVEEFSGALDLLTSAPDVGRRYLHVGIPGLRRLLLPATRYHVYYVHEGGVCLVLAVWSALRGRPPRLRGRRP